MADTYFEKPWQGSQTSGGCLWGAKVFVVEPGQLGLELCLSDTDSFRSQL